MSKPDTFQEVVEIMKNQHIVGLSVPQCCLEMGMGAMPSIEVRKIVSDLAVDNPTELLTYCKDSSAWQEHHDAAEAVFWRYHYQKTPHNIAHPMLPTPSEEPAIKNYPQTGHETSQGNWLDLEKGKQFHVVNGERVYSDELDVGVKAILTHERAALAKEKRASAAPTRSKKDAAPAIADLGLVEAAGGRAL